MGVLKMLVDSVKVREFVVAFPSVHCAAHNLNVIINDAAEATVEGISFFDTIANVFNFFGRGLNRWAEIAPTEDGLKNRN